MHSSRIVLYSAKSAAKHVGLSERTIRRAIAAGDLRPCAKIGGAGGYQITEAELERWDVGRLQNPTAGAAAGVIALVRDHDEAIRRVLRMAGDFGPRLCEAEETIREMSGRIKDLERQNELLHAQLVEAGQPPPDSAHLCRNRTLMSA